MKFAFLSLDQEEEMRDHHQSKEILQVILLQSTSSNCLKDNLIASMSSTSPKNQDHHLQHRFSSRDKTRPLSQPQKSRARQNWPNSTIPRYFPETCRNMSGKFKYFKFTKISFLEYINLTELDIVILSHHFCYFLLLIRPNK